MLKKEKWWENIHQSKKAGMGLFWVDKSAKEDHESVHNLYTAPE